jgi:hypothetical protein
MSFSTLLDPGNGMITAWAILAAEWWVFMGLAWYLEQVFASGTGNRRHPLFFLDCLRRVSQGRGARCAARRGGGQRWDHDWSEGARFHMMAAAPCNPLCLLCRLCGCLQPWLMPPCPRLPLSCRA